MNFYLNLIYDPVLKTLAFQPNRCLGTNPISRRDIEKLIDTLNKSLGEHEDLERKLEIMEGLDALVLMDSDPRLANSAEAVKGLMGQRQQRIPLQ